MAAPPQDNGTYTDETKVLDQTKEETEPDKNTETGIENNVPVNPSKTDNTQTKSKRKKKKWKKNKTKKPKSSDDTKDGTKGSDNSIKKGILVTKNFVLRKGMKMEKKILLYSREGN